MAGISKSVSIAISYLTHTCTHLYTGASPAESGGEGSGETVTTDVVLMIQGGSGSGLTAASLIV